MEIDEDAVRGILEACGANPGDVVEIVGPQFGRPEGSPKPVGVLPSVFTRLHTMSDGELRLLGCRAWDEPGGPQAVPGQTVAGHVLYLFPAEWYERIPNGFEVVTISGRREKFERGRTSDDRRFGVLAYGVLKALGEVSGG